MRMSSGRSQLAERNCSVVCTVVDTSAPKTKTFETHGLVTITVKQDVETNKSAGQACFQARNHCLIQHFNI